MSLSYPWVLPDANGAFRMWYGSTRTWDAGNGEMLHVINEASSADGAGRGFVPGWLLSAGDSSSFAVVMVNR